MKKLLISILLLITPNVVLASDPSGLVWFVTIPITSSLLVIALLVSQKSETKDGYILLVIVFAINIFLGSAAISTLSFSDILDIVNWRMLMIAFLVVQVFIMIGPLFFGYKLKKRLATINKNNLS